MKNRMPSWLRLPIVFFIIVCCVEFVVDSGARPAFISDPVVAMFLLLVLLLLVAIEAIISALDNVLFQSLDDKEKAHYLAKRAQPSKLIVWIKTTYKKLLGSKPIEKEHEIILDHNYDGIRELDNDLPPWWLYGFYASIIFACVYMLRFHVFNGENQYEELQSTLDKAKVELEAYKKTAKDLVDYNTVTVLVDASDLSNGKRIFESNCVACHMADGGGGIGPNLTDKHWILGGGIKNVFKTISEGGRDGKGMISWKSELKASEIAQVASYILSLQGTTPAKPKEPQGEVWVDENAPTSEVPTEAMEVKTDSVILIEN